MDNMETTNMGVSMQNFDRKTKQMRNTNSLTH